MPPTRPSPATRPARRCPGRATFQVEPRGSGRSWRCFLSRSGDGERVVPVDVDDANSRLRGNRVAGADGVVDTLADIDGDAHLPTGMSVGGDDHVHIPRDADGRR